MTESSSCIGESTSGNGECIFDVVVDGLKVTFTWKIADGIPLAEEDWVGLYADGVEKYEDFGYLKGRKEGKASLNAAGDGSFHLRYFRDDEEKARSNSFIVGDPIPPPPPLADVDNVMPGEECRIEPSVEGSTILFSWRIADGIPLNKEDSIQLFVLNGERPCDSVNLDGKKRGTSAFVAPCEGYFHLRYFRRGITKDFDRSMPILVGPSMEVKASYYKPDRTKVFVSWNRNKETVGDSIGLYPLLECDNDNFRQCFYTKDAAGYDGLLFDLPSEPGVYELRYFFGKNVATDVLGNQIHVFSGSSSINSPAPGTSADAWQTSLEDAEFSLDKFMSTLKLEKTEPRKLLNKEDNDDDDLVPPRDCPPPMISTPGCWDEKSTSSGFSSPPPLERSSVSFDESDDVSDDLDDGDDDGFNDRACLINVLSVTGRKISFEWNIRQYIHPKKKDWIGLYVRDRVNTSKYIGFVCLEGKKNGKGSLTAPCDGYFDLRFFRDNSYEEEGRSKPILVGPLMTLEVFYPCDYSTDKIVVKWDKSEKKKDDWLGLFCVLEKSNNQYLQWIDANNEGTAVFNLPPPKIVKDGEDDRVNRYEVRYFFSRERFTQTYVYSGRSNSVASPRDDWNHGLVFGVTEVESVRRFNGGFGELSFRKGERIRVFLAGSNGRWFGACDERSGWFPSSFVKRPSSLSLSAVISKDVLPERMKENLSAQEKQIRKQKLLATLQVNIADWGKETLSFNGDLTTNTIFPSLCYKGIDEKASFVFFNTEFKNLYDSFLSSLDELIKERCSVLNHDKHDLRLYATSSNAAGVMAKDFSLPRSLGATLAEYVGPQALIMAPVNGIRKLISWSDQEVVELAKGLAAICHNLKTCIDLYGTVIGSDQKIAAFVIDKNFTSPGWVRIAPGKFYNNVEQFLSCVVKTETLNPLPALRRIDRYLDGFKCVVRPGSYVEEMIDYCFILRRAHFYLAKYESSIGNFDYETVKFLSELRKKVTHRIIDNCFLTENNRTLMNGASVARCKILLTSENSDKVYVSAGDMTRYISNLRNKLVDMAKNIRGEVSPDDLPDKSLAVIASLATDASVGEKKKEIGDKIYELKGQMHQLERDGRKAYTKVFANVVTIVVKCVPAFAKLKSFYDSCVSGTKFEDGLKAFISSDNDGSASTNTSIWDCLKRQLFTSGVQDIESVANNLFDALFCYSECCRLNELILFLQDSQKKLDEGIYYYHQFVSNLKFYFTFINRVVQAESSDVNTVGFVLTFPKHESVNNIHYTIETISDASSSETSGTPTPTPG